MNSFIDEDLDLSSTGGVVKYTITPDNADAFTAQIDLATLVTTVGTALNKVFFDSIKDDLNSRLLISNKATQAQAEAGTNNTNYMTALRVAQACFAQRKVKVYEPSLTVGQWNTLNFSSYVGTNTRRVEIIGRVVVLYQSYLTNSASVHTKFGKEVGGYNFKIDYTLDSNGWNVTKIESYDDSDTAPTYVFNPSNWSSLSIYPRTRN